MTTANATTTAFTKSNDYMRYNNSIKPMYPTRRLSRSDYYYTNNSVPKVDVENTITLEHNLKDVESTLYKLMDSEIDGIGLDYYHYAFEAEKLLSNRFYSNPRIRYNDATNTHTNNRAYNSDITQKYSKLKMKQSNIDLMHHQTNGKQQLQHSAAPLSTLPSSNGIHTYATDTSTSNTPTPYYYHSPVQSHTSHSSLRSSPIASYNANNNCNDNAIQHKSTPRSGNRNVVYNKKSIKMSVPSSKRQILEEEFRKEKYPSNEKLQKLSTKLNMRYDEVQNYFKKRRREEKEGNLKFTNLVNLLNVYLDETN